MRSTPSEQRDRFEEAGLPGGVGSPDEVDALAEAGVEDRVAAEIEDGEGVERGDARRSSGPA
jgi:hypothetical protein